MHIRLFSRELKDYFHILISLFFYFCLFQFACYTVLSFTILSHIEIKYKLHTMPKDKHKQATNRVSRSCRQSRNTRSLKDKIKHKNSQSETKINNKNLSLSFYNQQTLSGSKKIMLDLLPIQSVQTEYFPVHGQGFRKWEKKTEVNPANNSGIGVENRLQQSFNDRSYRKVKINKNNMGRKNSDGIQRRRISQSRGEIEDKKDERRVKGECNGKEKATLRDSYIEKYLGKYFKKIGCPK